MIQLGGNRRNDNTNTTKKRVLIIVGVVVFIAAITAAAFFFWQYNAIKSNPESVSQEKVARVVERVGKIYALPAEKPTVADITDKDKLKDQAFFKDAENGDQLLIFSEKKLAIIYRESSNKLINVGPISLDDKTEQKTSDSSNTGQ